MGRRITKEEHDFIVANRDTMGYWALAEQLGRNPSSIRQYCYNHGILYANRKRRTQYTEQQHQFILDNPHLTVAQIAKHIGRSYDSVMTYVRKNNLTVRQHKCRPWTEDELHYLRELALTMNGIEIADELGRTHDAILTICYRHKIRLQGQRLKASRD